MCKLSLLVNGREKARWAEAECPGPLSPTSGKKSREESKSFVLGTYIFGGMGFRELMGKGIAASPRET